MKAKRIADFAMTFLDNRKIAADYEFKQGGKVVEVSTDSSSVSIGYKDSHTEIINKLQKLTV